MSARIPAVTLDWDDYEVLIAHWRNEEGHTGDNDPEYLAYCRRKVQRYQKAFHALKVRTEP